MTTHANSTIYKVGRWQFEPTLNRLCDEAVVVELEPIASRLLEVLCSAPGEVFSADQLVTRVWGDRIVSDNPIYKAMANLRKSLGEKSGGVRYIETIRKRGYRLVAEVSEVAVVIPQIDPQVAARPIRRPVLWPLLATGVAVSLLLAVAAYWASTSDPVQQDPPLVVVLPFETGPGFGDIDYVGFGLARSVASNLARAQGFAVVGDTSTTTMSDKGSDPRAIASSLGARFVVYGVVTQAEERLSLEIGLDDLEDSTHQWSAMFEQALRAEPYIQWEVAGLLTDQITEWVGSPESLTAPTHEQTSYRAYELYLRSRFLATRGGTEQLFEAERGVLDALALDDQLVAAMCMLASIEYQLVFHGLRTPEEAASRISPWMERALSLASDSADVHVALGKAKQITAAYSEAEQAFRTALRINPDHSGALQNLAWMLFNTGRLAEATPVYARALRVEPAAPMLMVSAGMNAEEHGRYECAEQLFERAVSLKPDFPNGHYGLAKFAWRVMGDFERARIHVDRTLALDKNGPILLSLAALVALDQGDLEAARDFSSLAYERAPNAYWPRRARMSLALYQGDFDVAQTLAATQLKFSEDDIPFRTLRDAALRTGDTAGAVAVYPSRLMRIDAATLDNRDVGLLADYAFALREDEQLDAAQRVARRVLELAPLVPHHSRDFAEVVAAEILGDRDLAMRKLEAALSDGWQAHRWWYWDRDPALAALRAEVSYEGLLELANSGAASGSAAGGCEQLYRFDPPPLVAAADQ